MTSHRLSELVMVGSRYWDHGEPGQVVKVDGTVVHVQVGVGVLKFDADTHKTSDPEWGSSIWIETPELRTQP